MKFRQVIEDLDGDLRQVAKYSADFSGGELRWTRRLSMLATPTLMCATLYRVAHWLYVNRFVRLAVLSGDLPARDFDRDPAAYLGCEWLPPKFDYVDPKKDVEAEILAINAGLKSRTQALSARVYYAEQRYAEITAAKQHGKGNNTEQNYNAHLRQLGRFFMDQVPGKAVSLLGEAAQIVANQQRHRRWNITTAIIEKLKPTHNGVSISLMP